LQSSFLKFKGSLRAVQPKDPQDTEQKLLKIVQIFDLEEETMLKQEIGELWQLQK